MKPLGERELENRERARNAVTRSVATGKLPPASGLRCNDCPKPAEEYDHYLGYEPEHWLSVEAVCRPCHWSREKARGTNRGRRTTESIRAHLRGLADRVGTTEAAEQVGVSRNTLIRAMAGEGLQGVTLALLDAKLGENVQ